MRVAIIAHPCRVGGGLVIAINFLKALKDVAEDERFIVICSAGCGYEEIELPAGSDIFFYTGSHSALARHWFETIKLPRIICAYKPDAIFGVGNIGLTNPCVPQAIFFGQAKLLYDGRHYPDRTLWERFRMAALQLQVKKSLAKTGLILCQTPVVKRRFAAKYRYSENSIKIVRFPPPVEIAVTSDLEPPAVFNKSGNNFYVLILTRYMAHRNPGILIALCRKYNPQIREQRIKFITTVGQSDHPKAPEFLRDISKYHLEDVIFNIGNIPHNEVSRYFCNSDLLWLPTFVETLCLPYLEAMRCGVPILAPDLDFAHYVCGSAAAFYNPWDIESIFSELMLLRENVLMRKQLIENAKNELCSMEKFSPSWEETTRDILRKLSLLVKRN